MMASFCGLVFLVVVGLMLTSLQHADMVSADPSFPTMTSTFFSRFDLSTSNEEFAPSTGTGYFGIYDNIHVEYGTICSQWTPYLSCDPSTQDCGINQYFYKRIDYSIVANETNPNSWYALSDTCPFETGSNQCRVDFVKNDGPPANFWSTIGALSTSIVYNNNATECQGLFSELGFTEGSVCSPTGTNYHACQLFQSKVIGGVSFKAAFAYTNNVGTNEGPLPCRFIRSWPGFSTTLTFTEYLDSSQNLSAVTEFTLPSQCASYLAPESGSCAATDSTCSSKTTTKPSSSSPTDTECAISSLVQTPPPSSLFQNLMYSNALSAGIHNGLRLFHGYSQLSESDGTVYTGAKFSRELTQLYYNSDQFWNSAFQTMDVAEEIRYFNSAGNTTDNQLWVGSTMNLNNPTGILPDCYHSEDFLNVPYFDTKTAIFDFLSHSAIKYIGCYDTDDDRVYGHKNFDITPPYPSYPSSFDKNNTRVKLSPLGNCYWYQLTIGGVEFQIAFPISYFNSSSQEWSSETMPLLLRRTELANYQWIDLQNPTTVDSGKLSAAWNFRNPVVDSTLECSASQLAAKKQHIKSLGDGFECGTVSCPPSFK